VTRWTSSSADISFLGSLLIERVELVVDHDDLEIAVLLDRGERFARGGDAGKGDDERIVQRPCGGVKPFDEFLQHQRFVVADKNRLTGFFMERRARGRRIVAGTAEKRKETLYSAPS